MGMCTAFFFKKFMPEDDKPCPMKKQENVYIYLLPSFLDVAGTITDTAGLFYVLDFLFLDKCFGKPNAQRISSPFHISNHSHLHKGKTHS